MHSNVLHRRVATIILKDAKLLLMHRLSDGKEYYVLQGGAVEAGESSEQALRRELKEETNLNALAVKKLWEIEDSFDDRVHHFFLVENFSGEVELGGEEAERNCKSDQHILEWHDLNTLNELLVYPSGIVEKLLLITK